MIKSYTDINQSKMLAEILPLESADMCFNTHNNMPPLMTPYSRFKEFFNMEPTPAFLIPCWSLATLLDVSPEGTMLLKSTNISSVGDIKYNCECYKISIDKWFDNPIDACVAMIEKLNELKML